MAMDCRLPAHVDSDLSNRNARVGMKMNKSTVRLRLMELYTILRILQVIFGSPVVCQLSVLAWVTWLLTKERRNREPKRCGSSAARSLAAQPSASIQSRMHPMLLSLRN
eukprot:6198452-Amphidinium_carterae.1